MHFTTIIVSLLASSFVFAAEKRGRGTAGQPCAADIDRLASGIQQNVLDQEGEVFAVQQLSNLFQSSNGTVNMGQFMMMKAQLLSFVMAGINVRQINQIVAPPGNPALGGMGMVAGSQQKEILLTSSLSGDRTTDPVTLDTLQKAFNSGMKQNMQNLLDATQGCVPSDIIAQRGVLAAQEAGLRTDTNLAMM